MDELKKYIKEQLKQKQKPKAIINNLVNSGYEEKTAKSKVYYIITLRYFMISGIIFFFLLASLFLILVAYYQSTIKTVVAGNVYSDDPSEWIISTTDNQSSIDTKLITKDNSYYNGLTQVYEIPFTDIVTVFELNGYYNGSYFDDEYVEGNMTLMRVSKTMKPDDGIIEGFIVERINDYKTNNITAFIFVDSDWRNQMPDTKVFFGSAYQYYTDFIFNEISPGVFMFEIQDDPERHFENFSISYGGIAVGDLNESNIINNDIEGKIFMRLYS